MKTQTQPRLLRGGFTLIELLAVIVIIGILAGISISGMSYFNRKSAEEKARAQIQLFSQGLEAFNADTGFYPPLRWNVDVHGSKTNNPLWNSYRTYRLVKSKTYEYPSNSEADTDKVTNDESSKALVWALGGQGNQNGTGSLGTIYVPDLVSASSDKQNMRNGDRVFDPFGSPFAYRPASSDWENANTNKTINPDFDLWSAGVDKKVGASGPDEDAKDDITNW